MIRLILAAAILFAVPAAARERTFLYPSQVDILRLLPPPPPPGSLQEAADYAETMSRQSARTPERAAQAAADAKESVFDMFKATLGDATPARLPRFHRMFERLGQTEEVLTAPAKAGFARPRPFVNHPEVTPSLPKPPTYSFPSGHATRMTLSAIVLAAMLPERRDEIFARAQDYAESRVIGGVHFQTDILGGMRAGTAIAAVLFNDPVFRAEFGPAQQEVRKALGLPN